MKILLSYLRKKGGSIALFSLFGIVCGVMLRLAGLPVSEARYAVFLCAFFAVGAAVLDFLRYRKTIKSLEDCLNCLPAVLLELPEAGDLQQQIYQEMILRLRDAYLQVKNENDRMHSDMTDYFSLWVHQVKTPIAAARLLLQGEEPPDLRQMEEELFHIERYAEMALQYLRLQSPGSDLVLAQSDLDPIVRRAVRKYAPLFIRSRVALDYETISCQVLTDEKWLAFVIEQLLSNALKYTPGGKVSIRLEEPSVLVIQDNGMGIRAEDLPRVFEKGFTGGNGRIERTSTGIGLYLCKRVMDQLGHRISIQSRPGEGTAVRLELDSIKTIYE